MKFRYVSWHIHSIISWAIYQYIDMYILINKGVIIINIFQVTQGYCYNVLLKGQGVERIISRNQNIINNIKIIIKPKNN